ncbi:MAG: ATP-binding protein [Caulobacterales bacterium]
MLTGEERGYLDRIHEASAALLTTVNDILDFSKLEAGHVEIERMPIDPADLGFRTLELFEPQLEKKGLNRQFKAFALPPQVLTDGTRIRQILMNLIGNAVKFTAAGGVEVRARFDLDRGVLRYEVADTGPGIAPERQSRLFQRFSQVDASTSRSFGGTGLGLAICKGLAEAMGGAVGVTSAPGEGSCFWVEIAYEPVTAPLEQDNEPAGIDLALALRELHLLVVDDNAANRELARLVSEPLGVIVTEAEGGAQAVRAAQSRAFDIILMDIRMPEIDGPTAAGMIRAKPGPNAATPIIAFTADATGDLPAAWDGLFETRLPKPIVAAELLLTLAAHRGQRAS